MCIFVIEHSTVEKPALINAFISFRADNSLSAMHYVRLKDIDFLIIKQKFS